MFDLIQLFSKSTLVLFITLFTLFCDDLAYFKGNKIYSYDKRFVFTKTNARTKTQFWQNRPNKLAT